MRCRIWIVLLLALLPACATGQGCTTTVLVSFYDQLTTSEIETLKAEDIEVKADGKTLPIVSFNHEFSNRLLILLETEGASKNDKIEETVNMAMRQARTAPEGKPVAFGIFAEKSLFTKEFIADPEKRAAAVNDVFEQAGTMGKHVALWDALHQAIALFGPHQPGDTILLVGEPYDDKSSHSGHDVEKELIAHGTRLFVMRRIRGSRVDRDFLWKSHELEKAVLERTTRETGGLLSEYVPSLIRFGWAGYMLEMKVPDGMARTQKWKVQFRGTAAQTHRKTNFYYQAAFPACAVTVSQHQ